MTPTTHFTFTCPRNSFKRKREHIAMTDDTDNLTKRSAGRPTGSKTRQTLASKINEEDRDYFGYDSRKFLERALLRASTWEEGLKIARELRALQHASLQAIQTKTDTTHTITLRWSTPEELPSNEKSLIELSVDNYEHKLPEETSTDGKKDNSNN